MKNYVGLLFALLFVYACGGEAPESKSVDKPKAAVEKPDDGKGIGEITTVVLNDPLDQEMVQRGKGIYEMKCAACHKTTKQRVVGPGFEGVTERRKPEWIMNMITNTEAMLDEDPAARAMFEECLTRMPNQNVAIADARDILEFFLDNDKGK